MGAQAASATSSRCAFSSTYSDRSRVTAVLMDSPRSWATMSARYHGSFGTAVVRRPVPRLFRAVPSTLKIGDSPASAASSALLAEYRSGNSTVSMRSTKPYQGWYRSCSLIRDSKNSVMPTYSSRFFWQYMRYTVWGSACRSASTGHHSTQPRLRQVSCHTGSFSRSLRFLVTTPRSSDRTRSEIRWPLSSATRAAASQVRSSMRTLRCFIGSVATDADRIDVGPHVATTVIPASLTVVGPFGHLIAACMWVRLGLRWSHHQVSLNSTRPRSRLSQHHAGSRRNHTLTGSV